MNRRPHGGLDPVVEVPGQIDGLRYRILRSYVGKRRGRALLRQCDAWRARTEPAWSNPLRVIGRPVPSVWQRLKNHPGVIDRLKYEEPARWKYGLYDTVDRCWFGDDKGPILHDNELLARAAAQILDVRLRNAPGRTRATLYDGGANVIKDEVSPTISAAEALRRIERGGL